LLTTFIITVSYIAYALAVSASFTFIIIIIGAALFIILRRFLFKSFHLGEGFVSSYNRLLKYIDDFWQTVKIAKVHSSEDFYYNNPMKPALLTWSSDRRTIPSTSLMDYRYHCVSIIVY
jgi:ATP-binding cassette subfamily C protein